MRLVAVDRQRTAHGVGGKMLFARLVAQSADVDPQPRVRPTGGERPVERRGGRAEMPRAQLELAERVEPALRARRVELARRKPAPRLVGIVLQQRRLAEIGSDRRVRSTGVERPPRGDFGGHAIAPFDGGRRLRERVVAPAGQRGKRQQGEQDSQEGPVRPASHSA